MTYLADFPFRRSGRPDSSFILRGARRAVGALAVAAVTMSFGTVSTVAAERCLPQDVERAVNMRILQSDLMVAALQCNARDDYNRFVRQYESELVQHGGVLRRHFKQVHGNFGGKRLNAFVTRLANESSLRSLEQGAAFCNAAPALFEEVFASKQGQLVRVANARMQDPARKEAACSQVAGAGVAQ